MNNATLRIVARKQARPRKAVLDELSAALTGNPDFAFPRELPPDPADRHGSYSEHYDIQFVVGMLLLLRSMVQGLDKRRLRSLLQRASQLEDIHGRFVRYRMGVIVFQPDDGPELMLNDDREKWYAFLGKD